MRVIAAGAVMKAESLRGRAGARLPRDYHQTVLVVSRFAILFLKPRILVRGTLRLTWASARVA